MLKKSLMGAVVFLFLAPAAMAEEGFQDVGDDFWASENIQYLKQEGIISGYSDGTFRPNAEVKRSQVAKMLAEGLDLELENRPNPGFSDVDEDFTGYEYIAATADEGIFGGKKDGRFAPNDAMTRGQMAAVLHRAFDLPERTAADIAIADMDPGDTFYDAVEAIAKAKITTVASGETFRPYEEMTRSQFTAFLSRSVAPERFIEEEESPADEYQTYYNEQYGYTVTFPATWGDGEYFPNDPDERGKYLYDKESGMIRVYAVPHTSDEFFPPDVEIKTIELQDGKEAQYYTAQKEGIAEFSMVLTHDGLVFNISGEVHPDFFAENEEDILNVMKSLQTESDNTEGEEAKLAADSVLSTLNAKDEERFASYVHPNKGVRFSPYAYVDTTNDLQFSASEMEDLWSDSTEYVWGQYDGSGFPIELTFEEYYDEFIYDRDYIFADETSINERLGEGNTIDNSQDVYNDAVIVEYHFTHSGNFMDWSSLRLAMEEDNGSWYVVGIIHDEWTI